MSTEFHSSNPFRRKATTASAPVEGAVLPGYDAPLQLPLPVNTFQSDTIDQVRVQTKPVKKVRVQSPPPSSPAADSIPQSLTQPLPRTNDIPRTDSDPFENATTESSEDSGDETETLNSTSVPPNPFQKTLATLERTDEGDSFTSLPHNSTVGRIGAGKASLDMEAFKQLLMTGSADAATPVSALAPPMNIGQLALNDGGSSTDASSSASRQSIFEPIQEIHPESPRTSHEISDADDERRRIATDGISSSERRKPPPPNSRHGKLIRVELKDEDAPRVDISLFSDMKIPPQPPISPLSTLALRSPTDLNKPLPAAPARASHESDRESIFDKEAAGKTPELVSPAPTQLRKMPPAPPLTRRHSQLVSESKAARPALMKRPTNMEEEGMNPSDYEITLLQSATKAPPPPPSRRPTSSRNSPQNDEMSGASPQEPRSPKSKSGSAPARPPARIASTRHSSRPPSVISVELTSKRVSAVAPPPPPPRQRASSRTSIEGLVFSSGSSRRASSDYFRKSNDSTREEALAPQTEHGGLREESSGANDILANLNALQREVDALRGQYELQGTN